MQRAAAARTGDLATYLTIPQAAVRLGVSPDTVRRRVKSGTLRAHRFAGKYRIHVDDIDTMVRSNAA